MYSPQIRLMAMENGIMALLLAEWCITTVIYKKKKKNSNLFRKERPGFSWQVLFIFSSRGCEKLQLESPVGFPRYYCDILMMQFPSKVAFSLVLLTYHCTFGVKQTALLSALTSQAQRKK